MKFVSGNARKQQRIAIYRLGSLGATMVAISCFHRVEQTWPDAERIVLTNFPVSQTRIEERECERGGAEDSPRAQACA